MASERFAAGFEGATKEPTTGWLRRRCGREARPEGGGCSEGRGFEEGHAGGGVLGQLGELELCGGGRARVARYSGVERRRFSGSGFSSWQPGSPVGNNQAAWAGTGQARLELEMATAVVSGRSGAV